MCANISPLHPGILLASCYFRFFKMVFIHFSSDFFKKFIGDLLNIFLFCSYPKPLEFKERYVDNFL
jgi:hypothetical protein